MAKRGLKRNMRNLESVVEDLTHTFVNVTDGPHKRPYLMMYDELNYLVESDFKLMTDGVGAAARIAMALNTTNDFEGWAERKYWIEQVILLVFLLWPIGVEKRQVLHCLDRAPEEIMDNALVATAVFMVRKIICGTDHWTPGTKMNIAAFRMCFPRLSFLANKKTKALVNEHKGATEYVQAISDRKWAGLLMVNCSKKTFNQLTLEWRLANDKHPRKMKVPSDEELRNITGFANMAFLSEEPRFISPKLKSIANNGMMEEDGLWIDYVDFWEQNIRPDNNTTSEDEMNFAFGLWDISSAATSMMAVKSNKNNRRIMSGEDIWEEDGSKKFQEVYWK